MNFGWLVRLYFGNMQMINEIGRDIHRPPGDPVSSVDTNPYTLERITELCMKLLRKSDLGVGEILKNSLNLLKIIFFRTLENTNNSK